MPVLLFLVCTLAVYRLSLMLSSEEGPAAIFARLRRKVPAKTNPGRGIRCFLCWTVWIAGAVTGYLFWAGRVEAWEVVPYWFGLSGAAVALNRGIKG